jgi:hypothetical protein
VLEHRIGVLQGLMQGLHDLAAEPGVACIDYRQLDGGTVRQVAAMFGLRCDLEGQRRIAQRMQRNAKLPGIRFEPDGARKAAVFDAAQSTAIARRLSSLHRTLLAATGPVAPAAHAEPEREVADVR